MTRPAPPTLSLKIRRYGYRQPVPPLTPSLQARDRSRPRYVSGPPSRLGVMTSRGAEGRQRRRSIPSAIDVSGSEGTGKSELLPCVGVLDERHDQGDRKDPGDREHVGKEKKKERQ